VHGKKREEFILKLSAEVIKKATHATVLETAKVCSAGKNFKDMGGA
jgi:hypothetical protein